MNTSMTTKELVELKTKLDIEVMRSTSHLELVNKFLDEREPTAWEPAGGGTEKEYTMDGKTYLYMWNPVSMIHATYCKDDDLFI